jgi:hypothetical protein
MKHILLIANLDGHSIPLLRFTARMCSALNMKLHILKIQKDTEPLLLSSPYYFNKTGFGIDYKLAGIKKESESFVLENTKDLIDSEWLSHAIMKGNLQQCLNKFINKEKIDLIIVRQAIFKKINIHENKTFKNLLLNVSELPMLIIPENQTYKQFKQIGFFTTFSDNDYKGIQWLLSNVSDIRIKLIHSSKTTESPENKKWVEFIRKENKGIKLTYLKTEFNLNEFIREEINTRQEKHDLIVMVTNKRNFWQRITDPNKTVHLISKLEVPCLVFKN